MIESANEIGDVTGALAEDAPVPKPIPHISAAWLVVPCLACDFLMVPVFSSVQGPPAAVFVVFALGIVGCVLAQGCLLAAWLAWNEGPFLRRLLTHWKIAAGLYLVWLVGFGLAVVRYGQAPPLLAATVALGVPLVSIAAQFPLWVARQWFGWRLVREQADSAPVEPPLAIRDLMLATLVVAASLALARLAPSPDAGEMWPVWGVAFVVASLISSIALLPAGALLLRMRPFGRGLAWSGLYAAAWIALPWIIATVVYVTGAAILQPLAIFVALSSLMITFAATLVLTAAIARDRGYRLASGRNRLQHPNSRSLTR